MLRSYGTEYERLLELIRADERLRELLVAGLPNVAAEVIYVVRYELALTLADVLARRTRIAMLGVVLDCVETVADLMAHELGWDDEQKAQQIAVFKAEYEREYLIH